jgi:hypothetical protein
VKSVITALTTFLVDVIADLVLVTFFVSMPGAEMSRYLHHRVRARQDELFVFRILTAR